ncbi:M20/M25/M40 family metallo-hydrolase [Lichenihabitans psoromatis]|uniref:M20/M25/M40 family metallo-hydrolase n=1 Tax=Lichenihabitans psoromatis TaxID=2528642 RepID=UPI0010355594|nr:M20/M25/M40 family metallo-hydrolase [Lichenihabitans psoromatis]
MHCADLPFAEDAFLERLQRWTTCESPTWDGLAIDRMLDIAARDLVLAGASVERIAGRMGFGGAVRGRFPHPKAAEPGLLVLAHLDTVHPVGTLGTLPWRRDGDRCEGPGILDMKAGACLAVQAMEELAAAGIATPLPVTILFTGDEEVGTPSTRDLIEAEARRHRFVLVPEPARLNGDLVTGRYAIARFVVTTTGRPSHAGARLAEGRSAIRAMADRIIAIEEMTTEDCTFSVGVVRGGQWVNCVATTCVAEVLSMAKRQEDLDRGVAAMLAMAGSRNGVSFDVTRGVTRPVWEPKAGTLAMVATVQRLASEMGLTIGHGSAGGGSDGNFTGALGIPTLDGLGAVGDGLHRLDEHIAIAATLQRGRLLAGLLATLM